MSPPPAPPGSAGSTTRAGSRLLDLYQRGKDKQWDATKRIDWDLPVDPANVMGTPDEFMPHLRVTAVGRC